MRTETITIYSYSELSEEAKATAYKAWEPDYAFEADNRRTLEAFCDAFGIEVYGYEYDSYCHSFQWRAKNEGDEEITVMNISGTACPSSSRPGIIWTKRSSARRNNRQTERTSATLLTSV